MADDATLFDSNKQSQTTADAGISNAEMTSAVAGVLVGEGRKYKSVEDLEKAYMNADQFIETLKEENRKLREERLQTKTIDDVLKRLEAVQTPHTERQPDDVRTGGVSVDDVAKIVEQTVTGLESKKTQETNIKKADRLMREAFGEKAQEVFEKQASTPELREVYTKLAAVDPVKFAGLFGVGSVANPGSQADSGGTVNTAMSYTDTYGSRDTQPGTREFYRKLRQENPNRYYSQEVQLEMDKAARTNPSKFFGSR